MGGRRSPSVHDDRMQAESERAETEARAIGSDELFAGARTLAIRHGSELYTLRITRADKLILTKWWGAPDHCNAALHPVGSAATC